MAKQIQKSLLITSCSYLKTNLVNLSCYAQYNVATLLWKRKHEYSGTLAIELLIQIFSNLN
jgi:hypothetical protein